MHASQDVYHLVTPFLKKIEPGISFGGIACCDQHEYEANLSVSKIYDCTVTGDMFKPFFFTHRFPPSEGQVLRMAKHFETLSGSESEVLWPSPISLWARDKRTMPKPGEGTPLANDVVWLGFLKYFADQIENKAAEEIKKCRQALRRVRVTFHFCESEDAANQLKWTIEQNVDNIASNQTLKGWKRICGFAAIRDDLHARQLPCNAEAVSTWLSSAKVSVSVKALSGLLRVFDRMNACGPEVMRCLDQMDSEYQTQHFFANTSVLSILCERTSVNKNSLLQNSLLAWTVQGLTLRALCVNDGRLKEVKATAPRESCLHGVGFHCAM